MKRKGRKSSWDKIPMKIQFDLTWQTLFVLERGTHTCWSFWELEMDENYFRGLPWAQWLSEVKTPWQGQTSEGCLSAGLPELGVQVLHSWKGLWVPQCPPQMGMPYAVHQSCHLSPLRFKKKNAVGNYVSSLKFIKLHMQNYCSQQYTCYANCTFCGIFWIRNNSCYLCNEKVRS